VALPGGAYLAVNTAEDHLQAVSMVAGKVYYLVFTA